MIVGKKEVEIKHHNAEHFITKVNTIKLDFIRANIYRITSLSRLEEMNVNRMFFINLFYLQWRESIKIYIRVFFKA